jgi:hypothetical protein
MLRLSVGAAMAIVVLSIPLTSCGDFCGNEVLSETQSPSGVKRAVVFQRSCGATTGFSRQVSVLPNHEDLFQKAGNTFIADMGQKPIENLALETRWSSADELVVTYPARARVFLQETRARGVKISYEKVPDSRN